MSPSKSQYYNYTIPLPSPCSSSSGTDSSFPCGRSQAPSRASSVECVGNRSANVHASSESNNGAQLLTCENLKVMQKKFRGQRSRQSALEFRVWDWEQLQLREEYVREEENEEYEEEIEEGEGAALGKEKISQECPDKKCAINPIANDAQSETRYRIIYPVQGPIPMIRHFDDNSQQMTLDPRIKETPREKYAREEREMWTGNSKEEEEEETVREYWEKWGGKIFAKEEAEGEEENGESVSLIASSPTLPAFSAGPEKEDRAFDLNETPRKRLVRMGKEGGELKRTSSSAAPTLTPTPPHTHTHTPVPTNHSTAQVTATPEKGTKTSGLSFLERSLANQLPFPLPRVNANIHTSPNSKSDSHSKRIRKSCRKLNEKEDQNVTYVPQARKERKAQPQRRVLWEETAGNMEESTSRKSGECIPASKPRPELESAASASPGVIPTTDVTPPAHRVFAPQTAVGNGNRTRAIAHGTAFLERSFANTVLKQNLVTRPLPPVHRQARISLRPHENESENENHKRTEPRSKRDQSKIANQPKPQLSKHVWFSECTKLEDGGARLHRKVAKMDLADKGKKALQMNKEMRVEKRNNADDNADVWIDVAREFAGEDVEWEH